ncbi:hypothetical protein KFE25_003492 [Diacronema lutheri]|uniref:HSF-type DNA-binding domain-containing protein n=1 Tax=Diacronema lutheri TaxID=2081491 RepID=A0A8J5XIE1_DIALT|nr:hypothetical protein KFE25_003492 [Diacronema lutheri]
MRPPPGAGRAGHREALDKVPPFLLKLWEIVENNSVPADGSSPCVSWGAEGKSFVIHETETFARNILPLYFKHDNIRSFMRQLNIYSFIRCPKKANATGNRNAVEFSHPNFIRGCIYLLTEFKRGTSKLGAAPGGGSSSPGHDQCTPPVSAAAAGKQPGPTISALREEVMTLKDSIAHLEQEMLHHTSVTHDHMKKLAALIVSFQDAPLGPPAHGSAGGAAGAQPGQVVSSQFAHVPPAATMADGLPGFAHVAAPPIGLGVAQQQALLGRAASGCGGQQHSSLAPSGSDFSNGNGGGGRADAPRQANGSGGTCANAADWTRTVYL